MPSPLPRLIPRSQKSTIVIASGLLLLLLAAGVFVFYQRSQPVVREINSTELRALGETGAAASLKVDDETLIVTGRDGVVSQAIVTNTATQNEIISVFVKNDLPVNFRSLKPSGFSTAMTYMIPFFVAAVLGFVVWRVYAHMGGRGGDFNLADSGGKQNVNFSSVAGVDEAKQELSETIEFLTRPAKVRPARRARSARHTPLRPSGNGQDSARARRGQRGGRSFPFRVGLQLPGEIRRDGRGPRAPSLQRGAQALALRHLH